MYTYRFQAGSPSSLFISDPPSHLKTFDLLQTTRLLPIPDVDGEAQVKDEHISAVHGAPSKFGLLNTDVPTTFDMQQAWLILVLLDLLEP